MLADPALGALLESNFATGVDSVAAGTAALTAQRRFVTAFMRRYLRPCHDDRRASRRHTGAQAPWCDLSARTDSMQRAPLPSADSTRDDYVYRDGATRGGDVAITEAPSCPGKGPCSPRLRAPMRRVVVAPLGFDVSG